MFSGELHPLFEPSILEGIVELTPWWIAYLLVYLTYLGSIFVIVPIVVFAYWWDHRRFGPWIGAVIGYYGLMAGIKSLNSATRPDVAAPVGSELFPTLFVGWFEHATAISTTSFPSGNVMAATIIAGLIVLDMRFGTVRKRAIGATLVVLGVSYTRLGLGVHYPIDVISGLGIGLAYLACITVIRRRATDQTLAMFLVGLIFSFWSVLLIGGPTSLPSGESLIGSNRTIALGAAIGGLCVWWFAHGETRSLSLLSRSPLPLATVLGITAVVYGLATEITHPGMLLLWASTATGAILSLPWILPTRHQARAWLSGKHKTSDEADIAD